MARRAKSGWGGQRPGAGRPKLDRELKRMSVDLDVKDAEALREIAEERGVSVARLAATVLTRFVRRTRRK